MFSMLDSCVCRSDYFGLTIKMLQKQRLRGDFICLLPFCCWCDAQQVEKFPLNRPWKVRMTAVLCWRGFSPLGFWCCVTALNSFVSTDPAFRTAAPLQLVSKEPWDSRLARLHGALLSSAFLCKLCCQELLHIKILCYEVSFWSGLFGCSDETPANCWCIFRTVCILILFFSKWKAQSTETLCFWTGTRVKEFLHSFMWSLTSTSPHNNDVLSASGLILGLVSF